MDLLEKIIYWVLDNPGDTTTLGIIVLILRKLMLSEIARVFQMARDEEIIWTREQVEKLIGEKWNGPQPILKRVRIRYIVRYYSYLLLGSKQVHQLGRGKTMQQTINFSVLFLAIAGAIKLILQPFGIDLSGVTDESVNTIANGVGALFAVIGIIRNNIHKGDPAAPVQAATVKPQNVDPDKFIQG